MFKKIKRTYNFMYGSCLLLSGVVLGSTIGLCINGFADNHTLLAGLMLIISISSVPIIFADWKERLDNNIRN